MYYTSLFCIKKKQTQKHFDYCLVLIAEIGMLYMHTQQTGCSLTSRLLHVILQNAFIIYAKKTTCCVCSKTHSLIPQG